jgi:predicted ferric reductase
MMTDNHNTTNKEEEEGVEDVEIQEQTTTTTTTEGGMTIAKVHITDSQVPMVGMFFTAVILLVAVLVPGKDIQNWAYGVSVASVTMVFSLVGFLLALKEELNDKIGKFNAYFLFLWCFIGACILTFGGPFTNTGNGYFAAWGMAICSIVGVGVTGEEAKTILGKMGALLGLGASSIVVIIAIIPEIRDWNYRNAGIYALVVAICSLLIVAVFQKKEGMQKVKFITLAFFAILWILLAAFVTFDGPFLITGNGYFGSWAGAITSVMATMAALKE